MGIRAIWLGLVLVGLLLAALGLRAARRGGHLGHQREATRLVDGLSEQVKHWQELERTTPPPGA